MASNPLRSVFLGPRRLRAGWRFALFVVLLFVAQAIVQFVLVHGHVPEGKGFAPGPFAISELVSFVFILAITRVMGLLDRMPLAAYGFPPRGALQPGFWIGWLWGFAAVAAIVAPIALMGGVRWSGLRYAGAQLVGMTLLWFVVMLGVGLAEELLFRAYPLRALADGMGFWPAALLLSVGFGAIHFFGKPFETPVDFASVGSIGLFLCWTLRRTGDLWWAIGFHAGFDFAQLSFFAGPNSGNGGVPVEQALLVPHWQGPEWLTGGKLGIEASLFVFPVMVLLAWLFGRAYREVKFPPRD
jgi:membrane protease YdiL (CAAX protease family)